MDELQWIADPFRTRFERRSDGTILLPPQGVLAAYPPRHMDFLKQWATRASLRTAMRRIRRALLLPSPPSLDHGEITDKGSINQRAVLRHRADLVAALYAPDRVAHVMEIDAP